MSDGYRDDGTGTEDWGVTRITDKIAAWSERRNGLDFYADRLRDTAETLRQWIAWRDNAPDCECIVVTAHTAREILARLEKEGLT